MTLYGIRPCPWAYSCIFGIEPEGWGRRTCGRDHFDCPVYFSFNWGWRSVLALVESAAATLDDDGCIRYREAMDGIYALDATGWS